MKFQSRDFHQEKTHIQKDKPCYQGHRMFDTLIFKDEHGTKIAIFFLMVYGLIIPMVVPQDKKPFIPFGLCSGADKTAKN